MPRRIGTPDQARWLPAWRLNGDIDVNHPREASTSGSAGHPLPIQRDERSGMIPPSALASGSWLYLMCESKGMSAAAAQAHLLACSGDTRSGDLCHRKGAMGNDSRFSRRSSASKLARPWWAARPRGIAGRRSSVSGNVLERDPWRCTRKTLHAFIGRARDEAEAIYMDQIPPRRSDADTRS